MITQPIEISADQVRLLLSQPPKFGYFSDLRNRVVTEALNLAGQTLSGCDFSGTTFAHGVDFSGTVFRGISWFRNTIFRENVRFVGACFWNDARFDHSEFQDTADFSEAEFRGIGNFDHLLAHKGLVLNRVLANGNLSLAHSTFHGPAQIACATIMGGLWCVDANTQSFKGIETSDIYGRVVID